MRNKNNVVLFDIDHTLFDMGKFRTRMFGEIVKKLKHEQISGLDIKLEEVYFLYRQESGTFDPRGFVDYLVGKLNIKTKPETLEKAITRQELFYGHLFDETKEVLKKLSRNKSLRIGIFSGGNTDFQKSKIKEIEKHFHMEHIHIFTHKSKELGSLIERYRDHNLYIVDDQLEILHFAKKSNKNIFTIWSKRGRFALSHEGIPGFEPDLTITNLREIIKIVSP